METFADLLQAVKERRCAHIHTPTDCKIEALHGKQCSEKCALIDCEHCTQPFCLPHLYNHESVLYDNPQPATKESKVIQEIDPPF